MVETSQNILGTTRAERILNITKNRYFNFKFPDFKNRTFCFFNWRASASLSRTIPIPPALAAAQYFGFQTSKELCHEIHRNSNGGKCQQIE